MMGWGRAKKRSVDVGCYRLEAMTQTCPFTSLGLTFPIWRMRRWSLSLCLEISAKPNAFPPTKSFLGLLPIESPESR